MTSTNCLLLFIVGQFAGLELLNGQRTTLKPVSRIFGLTDLPGTKPAFTTASPRPTATPTWDPSIKFATTTPFTSHQLRQPPNNTTATKSLSDTPTPLSRQVPSRELSRSLPDVTPRQPPKPFPPDLSRPLSVFVPSHRNIYRRPMDCLRSSNFFKHALRSAFIKILSQIPPHSPIFQTLSGLIDFFGRPVDLVSDQNEEFLNVRKSFIPKPRIMMKDRGFPKKIPERLNFFRLLKRRNRTAV